MKIMHEPCLQWVKVNGEIHHVSEYSNLEPWHRPDAYCPMCENPVLLKLGEVRTHHAAHYEGAICSTSQPETIIHLNSKYYLKQILASIDQIRIWQSCNGWKPESYRSSCHRKSRHETIYMQGWDRVEIEWQFAKYRLDVALLKENQVVGAIEVLVAVRHVSADDTSEKITAR